MTLRDDEVSTARKLALPPYLGARDVMVQLGVSRSFAYELLREAAGRVEGRHRATTRRSGPRSRARGDAPRRLQAADRDARRGGARRPPRDGDRGDVPPEGRPLDPHPRRRLPPRGGHRSRRRPHHRHPAGRGRGREHDREGARDRAHRPQAREARGDVGGRRRRRAPGVLRAGVPPPRALAPARGAPAHPREAAAQRRRHGRVHHRDRRGSARRCAPGARTCRSRPSRSAGPRPSLPSAWCRWSTPTRRRSSTTRSRTRRGRQACSSRRGRAPTTPSSAPASPLDIAHANWNDLRRTFAQWLRQSGATPDLIAPAMGHTTTAMVQRVYGRPDPEVLGALLRRQMGLPGGTAAAPGAPPREIPQNQRGWPRSECSMDCSRYAADGDTVDNTDAPGNEKAPEFRGFRVGHDRLELSANGLRVRCSTN